ncbi:RNA polymerase sigma factor, partial [Streptomyces sp. NPDC058875]|uniref:RNA polymerase sigma factor n=1 Tax=Streptomyces sp. NPDC058875 TaxID=3346663 RepID=UPI0036926827
VAAAVVPDHAEEVAGRLDDRQQIAATLAQLGALRGPEREVLLLCLCEGLEYAEAARALGIPVGTVRSRLSRARTKLRKLADAEMKKNSRELAARSRQTYDDRAKPVRSAQEGI